MAENCTLDLEQAVLLFKEYNLFITAFLLFLTILLQYGYATRSRIIYILKMIVLWCFWPLNIAVGVISCIYPPNTGGLVAAIILTVFVCLSFVGYWIRVRLFSGVGHGGLLPRVYAVSSILLTNGQQCNFAIESVPMVLAPIIKNGSFIVRVSGLLNVNQTTCLKTYLYAHRIDVISIVWCRNTLVTKAEIRKGLLHLSMQTQSVDTGELESVATGGSSLYT
uniref:Membrane protein n=1 Tax=Infectious bronchitis virus TaxID=11120 RepID=G3C7B1_9GAMC|nr:membrane protein [Infectious bronchitis virus]